ncbi:MAG: hypothetical protein M1348_03235 [Candidatus Parvarchaeota archaeon]|jgi:RPA family protein|nr:hypothetical protein [Candidatus Parvarchaeota archaeon]
MLPLSIVDKAEHASDGDGNFVNFKGTKIYRLRVIGTIAAMEINEESGSGYIILDDTFSTILVHFQRPMFGLFKEVNKGTIVEVLGTIDVYNESTTLELNNIKKTSLERYAYNQLESIKNEAELSK